MSILKDGSYRRVAIKQAPAQTGLVDDFLEEAPFLAATPTKPTTSGMLHKWRKLVEVQGAKAVTMDGALPVIGVTKSLESTEVGLSGGIMRVGKQELAEMEQSLDQYFADNTGPVLVKAGADLEHSVIYNTVYPFSTENSKDIDAGGTDDGNMYSLFVITFNQDDCIGLFNPRSFGNGKMFDMEMVNGGNLYEIETNTDGSAVTGYGMEMRNNFGFLTGNKRRVATIRNIDLAADGTSDTGYKALPTEAMMREVIRSARAKGNTSFIVSTPEVFDAMETYSASALRMSVTDDEYNTEFLKWNSIPWIATYNMDQGTEAQVTIA